MGKAHEREGQTPEQTPISWIHLIGGICPIKQQAGAAFVS
jgi:hypothetical protein